MKPLNDKWIRVGGIAVLVLSGLYYQNAFAQLPTWDATLLQGTAWRWYNLPQLWRAWQWPGGRIMLECLTLSTLSWEACRAVLLQSRRIYPRLDQSRTRLLLALVACWATAALIDILDMLLINATGFRPAYSTASILNGIPGGLATALIVVGAQEAIYYFNRTLRAEKEAEQLKKENLQTQLDSLKQQVNPHFLFNSLNTLSYLIGEDALKAEEFLNEMCKVYRHLLHSNESELTSLATEIQFIKSYFHLLKTRYGNCLWLDMEIDDKYENHLIPSLTLQLLVENAVKHNVIHKDHPLRIKIVTDEPGWLTVKNNLQTKEEYIPSNKIGLNNIVKKFELLKQPSVVIEKTEAEFIVSLPIIAA
ncbi:sensor histidine kinase [Hymenobacter jeollabukensis]|uniref:Histidine kinase n=1 Tax=Hymenobacter jeollabukensis TaxID=2025313 RepID=A0A5R8WK94_9BACT|nr:histidine kinase [Hymenobacter jeollabukensis]TLM88921.1 histidine kinase [Hymenobacter jeollabukensis]